MRFVQPRKSFLPQPKYKTTVFCWRTEALLLYVVLYVLFLFVVVANHLACGTTNKQLKPHWTQLKQSHTHKQAVWISTGGGFSSQDDDSYVSYESVDGNYSNVYFLRQSLVHVIRHNQWQPQKPVSRAPQFARDGWFGLWNCSWWGNYLHTVLFRHVHLNWFAFVLLVIITFALLVLHYAVTYH